MDKAQAIFSVNSFLKSYEEVKNINTLKLGIKYQILSVKLKNKPHEKDWGIFLLATENSPPQKYWCPQFLIKYCSDAGIDLKNLFEFGNIYIKTTFVDRIDIDRYVTHFTFGTESATPIWITKYLDMISKFNENYKNNKARHKEAIQNYVKICTNISERDIKEPCIKISEPDIKEPVIKIGEPDIKESVIKISESDIKEPVINLSKSDKNKPVMKISEPDIKVCI